MEKWKIIPGYDQRYEVSDQGRVRTKYKKSDWKIMHGGNNGLGYYKVTIRDDEGRKKQVYIHRLVALAFIKNTNNKPCVNHIDNDPTNNLAENLEWCTKQENTNWMIIQGRNQRTETWRNHNRESQRKRFKPVIRTDVVTGLTFRYDNMNLVRFDGFSPGCVCTACKNGSLYRGYRWKYAQENKSHSHTDQC